VGTLLHLILRRCCQGLHGCGNFTGTVYHWFTTTGGSASETTRIQDKSCISIEGGSTGRNQQFASAFSSRLPNLTIHFFHPNALCVRTHKTCWNRPEEIDSGPQIENITLVASLRPQNSADGDSAAAKRATPPLRAVQLILQLAEFQNILENAIHILRGERNSNQLTSLLVGTREGSDRLDLVPALLAIVDDDDEDEVGEVGDEENAVVDVGDAKEVLRALLDYSRRCCSVTGGGDNAIVQGWSISKAAVDNKDEHGRKENTADRRPEGWVKENWETAKSFVRACLMQPGDNITSIERKRSVQRESNSKKKHRL